MVYVACLIVDRPVLFTLSEKLYLSIKIEGIKTRQYPFSRSQDKAGGSLVDQMYVGEYL